MKLSGVGKMFSISVLLLLAFLAAGGKTDGQSTSALARDDKQAHRTCLPTGVCLDAAGRSAAVGNMPLAMILSPEGDRLILSLSGWREQGLQVVDLNTGEVLQTIPQPSAFLGLAFSSDGKTLYASGGNDDLIYIYDWQNKTATLKDKIILAEKRIGKNGTRFPAGIALSTDDTKLYVAENLGDSLAVIDLETKKVEQRLPVETYPYAISVTPGGKVFVSSWGGNFVSAFAIENGTLTEEKKIAAGRHPSALLLNKSGTRLFIASAGTNQISVIDTRTGTSVANLTDAPPSKGEGSTPNALALSADGTKLFVAEADNNAVAVFTLSKRTSDVRIPTSVDRLLARIPVDWYPTAMVMTRSSLFVLNGKGKGTHANPAFPPPGKMLAHNSTEYVLGQLNGTLTTLPAEYSNAELRRFSKTVSSLNNWDTARRPAAKYPPFKHIIYIIKENRTFDQVFGDLKNADGDASLLFFDNKVSPNHRALADRFGIYDRFFVNAEVSQQGHVWSTAAYVTDYGEKTIPSTYSNKRDPKDRDDVDEPAGGYLWDAAIRKGLSLRNYGEFGEPIPNKDKAAPIKYRAAKPALDRYTNHDYPVFDMKISDQARFNVWQKDFREFVKNGNLPTLEILHLPRDHTGGARAGLNTPKACFADNDFALGRIVEAVSNSPYWKDTLIVALEDDAQDGPDHVDSHRSVLFTISAYNKPGSVIHRFVNTTDVFATMEEILGLPPLSQFDFYGRPLRGIFDQQADLRPFTAIRPEQPLDEINPSNTKNAAASVKLNLDEADLADMDLFNRILWDAIKGESVPYPETKRISSLELTRSR